MRLIFLTCTRQTHTHIAEEVVKFFKVEIGMFGVKVRVDYMALMFDGYEFPKAELVNERVSNDLTVLLVASVAGAGTAFAFQFDESLLECEQRLHGRGESKLSVRFGLIFIFVFYVEAKTCCGIFNLGELLFFEYYERKSGHGLETLVRRTYQKVYVTFGKVDFDCAKAAHCIHYVNRVYLIYNY